MITYASRKRSFAAFADEADEGDSIPRSLLHSDTVLPTPPPSSPKALQETSDNTTRRSSTSSRLLSPPQSDPFDSITDIENAPPSSPPFISSLYPHDRPRIPALKHSASAPSTTKPSMVKRPKLTQTTIDLGGPAHIKCKTCGMEYTPSAAQDRALHATYHAASVGGVDVPAKFQGRVIARIEGELRGLATGRGHTVSGTTDIHAHMERKGKHVSKAKRDRQIEDKIVEVTADDKLAVRRYAKKVLEHAERELGAVETAEAHLWSRVQVPTQRKDETMELPRFQVYLYIRESKCVGLLLAQRIEQARLMSFPHIEKTVDKDNRVRLTTLQEAQELQWEDALGRSSREGSAALGISRIWVSQDHQRCGIAWEMLERARRHVRLGAEVKRNDVAFSQPTEAGMALIKRWTTGRAMHERAEIADGRRQDSWLMYNEWDEEERGPSR